MNPKRASTTVIVISLLACCFPLQAADLEKVEAYWKAEIVKESMDQAYTIEELARVRERMGKFQLAIDTWGYLKKTRGKQNAFNDSSAPDVTYAELADFKIQRIKRIKNQIAHPPTSPSAELRGKLNEAQEAVRQELALGKAGCVHLMTPVDTDGDLVPELFTVGGERESLDEPAKMILVIHRWNGQKYVEAFRWSDDWQLGKVEQPDFRVEDREAWGMYSVTVGFNHETDNAASIQSNGQKIMWAH